MSVGAPGVPATLVGAAASRPRRPHQTLGRATLGVALSGILLTAALAWAASRAHGNNERRLLDEQAEEASAVLQLAIPGVTGRALEATRIAGLLVDDVHALRRELSADVEQPGRFASITVVRGGEVVAELGAPPMLRGAALEDAALATSGEERTVHVTGLLDGDDPRIAYSARSAVAPDVVVHGEQRVQRDRINATPPRQAFDGIDIALYLGDTEDRDQLLLATTPELPLEGRRTTREIPLGDDTMLFVVTPIGTLGGHLLRLLAGIVAAAGLTSTVAAAALVESLYRRRRDAEAFTEDVHALYRHQQEIAHTLQHSLLPTHLERLEGIEVAARYFAGAEGAEIGGDWYDVIAHPDRFTVVVGDVVGRGVQAAAVMAAMRYGTHAVARQETQPGRVLEAVNGLEHIRGDFVTMLCGTVEPVTGTVRFATAGHPAPLLISAEVTRFLRLDPGPPIGFLDDATYRTKRTTVPSGAVLVLFTDGLYERRGESIDVGLERLRGAAERLVGRPVEEILEGLAEAMLGDGVRDDTAMLGFRVP